RRSYPDVAVHVAMEGTHHVAHQAVFGADVTDAPGVHVEAIHAARGAEIHAPGPILRDRPDGVTREPVAHGIVSKDRVFRPRVPAHGNAVEPEADPQPATVIAEERARIRIARGHPLARRIGQETIIDELPEADEWPEEDAAGTIDELARV